MVIMPSLNGNTRDDLMGYALFNRNLIWLCPSKYLVYPQFGQFNGDSDALRHDIYTILGVYMYIYIYLCI